ncbi:MAG: type I secretion system permease/ATPase [Pelatocladus maniniholoensis HA4357-MV3]|jgi:HlyB family type I secretion system ABC transporter|uniref:Type I secretion system permease/ATPase n=1 Tax=Pelatocladus maniniholoensis HA4357-MV3 TaxID=1117104 RepID=A0A9E3H671_9NOST|nr:type I secretion system permease/ATPase [Pelatocladus maniniholoensis HA4357-MV3]
MTQTSDTIQTFLSGIPPFKQLSPAQLQQLSNKLQVRRYGMGQAILPLQESPPYIAIIYTGKARLIGNNSHSDIPVTLYKLKPGEIIGWKSLLQGIPCEKVMACEEETLCLVLASEEFLTLLEEEPILKAWFAVETRSYSIREAALTSVYASVQESINSPIPNPRSPLPLIPRGGPTFPNSQSPIPNPQSPIPDPHSQNKKYPHKRDSSRNATLACLQMVSQYFGMPFRKENIRKAIANNHKDATKPVSLQLCGAIADFMGLKAQLVTVPASAMNRLPTPALIHWQDSMAVVYETSDRQIVLGVPERGIVRQKMTEFLKNWGEQAQVLLLTTTSSTPQQKFGLSWFLPSLNRHRTVLLEVLIASFFVQLFGLANPLMIQVIIDKVLVQNSIDTLQVLGVFLLLAAIFEAVLGTLRTYLFAEATNRIDLALGSEIIDHLLRLPLRYFDRHPVGELATRVNELENIRSFLTGTALTVVLDSVFSVIYIVVMVIYSWVLTLVSLSTIPLFAILSLVAAPIVRRQLREKAERNAQTQSYLVEVLSGIQTVKAQNIELRTRWQWQEHYARYVSSGFKTIVTSTAASSASNFLNQLSGLLVLWVGAYLVLKGELSLGQLIAFRIIAGYVTSPLLRLLQLWQNFQQTALSLERLSDIVDTPQEVTQIDQDNIPMPVIQGAVTYENVSFRFAASGSLQLDNINLAFPAQRVVGVVGMSGSGKSTLMKLLPRLYELNAGRILIDGYDISKVELYSLRSQIGIIPQDTLLFDGTVIENIALTNPEASSEEVITAAKIAVAHDFIMNLPNGYNTRVGERGSALSGGQRQRIAIARTILQNPQLLILDEATSALDYDTERQVCTNLIQAFRGRTMFIITHRLSTIQQADEIVLMHQGKVAERGTHNQLMHQRGRYYHLYQQQDGLGTVTKLLDRH